MPIKSLSECDNHIMEREIQTSASSSSAMNRVHMTCEIDGTEYFLKTRIGIGDGELRDLCPHDDSESGSVKEVKDYLEKYRQNRKNSHVYFENSQSERKKTEGCFSGADSDQDKYSTVSRAKLVLEWASATIVRKVLGDCNIKLNVPEHTLLLDHAYRPVAILAPFQYHMESILNVFDNYGPSAYQEILSGAGFPLELYSTLLLLPGLLDMPDLLPNLFYVRDDVSSRQTHDSPSNTNWRLLDFEQAFLQFQGKKELILTSAESVDFEQDKCHVDRDDILGMINGRWFSLHEKKYIETFSKMIERQIVVENKLVCDEVITALKGLNSTKLMRILSAEIGSLPQEVQADFKLSYEGLLEEFTAYIASWIKKFNFRPEEFAGRLSPTAKDDKNTAFLRSVSPTFSLSCTTSSSPSPSPSHSPSAGAHSPSCPRMRPAAFFSVPRTGDGKFDPVADEEKCSASIVVGAAGHG